LFTNTLMPAMFLNLIFNAPKNSFLKLFCQWKFA